MESSLNYHKLGAYPKADRRKQKVIDSDTEGDEEKLMATITQIYEKNIRPLPAADRLRLATMILQDVAPAKKGRAKQSLNAMVEAAQYDEGDEESERDLWLGMSAETARRLWDNPLDAADWDNWKPPKKGQKREKGKSK